MKKAINAWSIPKHISFDEMFFDISSAGFDGIELNLDADGFSQHSLTMNSGNSIFKEINLLIEEFNLPVTSISTSLCRGQLGSDDKAVREYGKDIIRKQLECAAELNTDGILTVPGGMNGEILLKQAFENSFTSLEELKYEISASKISVGLENVWNGFFISPFDMKYFIDRLNCTYIKAYFDIGNVVAFSDPEYWIEILGSRICKIHLKDFMRNGGINSGGCFVNLLEGDVNWDKVMRTLRASGFDGYLTAELPVMQKSPEYLYHITNSALDILLEMK